MTLEPAETGARIKANRERLQLTQRDLGALVGLTQHAVSRIELISILVSS